MQQPSADGAISTCKRYSTVFAVFWELVHRIKDCVAANLSSIGTQAKLKVSLQVVDSDVKFW